MELEFLDDINGINENLSSVARIHGNISMFAKTKAKSMAEACTTYLPNSMPSQLQILLQIMHTKKAKSRCTRR